MDNATLILEEVRGLRADLQDHIRTTENRLTTLETQIKPLFDNGQPGILSRYQKDISDLKGWKWRLIGIATGVSATITSCAWLINFARK